MKDFMDYSIILRKNLSEICWNE